MRRTLILMSLLLAGCPLPTDDSGGTIAPEDWSACRSADGRPIQLDTGGANPVRVDGNTLQIDVSYGGGCEEHVFAICWPDQSFAESDPVQASLEIWHGGPPDYCDAMLSETLEFDLTYLHDQWQMSYGADGGTIILNVEGAPESVEYTFDG